MDLAKEVPASYPAVGTVRNATKKEYVRIQRTKAERRARRTAGVEERKAVRRAAMGAR